MCFKKQLVRKQKNMLKNVTIFTRIVGNKYEPKLQNVAGPRFRPGPARPAKARKKPGPVHISRRVREKTRNCDASQAVTLTARQHIYRRHFVDALQHVCNNITL